MRSYLRLAIVLFLTTIPWMWCFGDYNWYLGEGNEREFKGFPSPEERLLYSLCLGALYSMLVLLLVWIVDGGGIVSFDADAKDPTSHAGETATVGNGSPV
jgi:hypothetical protein